MTDPLKRRIDNKAKAASMSDREIRETTFVELCELNHHVVNEMNGKLRTLWGVYVWTSKTFKVLVTTGTFMLLLFGVLKAMGKM